MNVSKQFLYLLNFVQALYYLIKLVQIHKSFITLMRHLTLGALFHGVVKLFKGEIGNKSKRHGVTLSGNYCE